MHSQTFYIFAFIGLVFTSLNGLNAQNSTDNNAVDSVVQSIRALMEKNKVLSPDQVNSVVNTVSSSLKDNPTLLSMVQNPDLWTGTPANTLNPAAAGTVASPNNSTDNLTFNQGTSSQPSPGSSGITSDVLPIALSNNNNSTSNSSITNSTSSSNSTTSDSKTNHTMTTDPNSDAASVKHIPAAVSLALMSCVIAFFNL